MSIKAGGEVGPAEPLTFGRQLGCTDWFCRRTNASKLVSSLSFALAVYASFGPLARSGFTVKRPTSHFSAIGSDVDSKGEAAENAMLSTAHGAGRVRSVNAVAARRRTQGRGRRCSATPP
jgi:hypothetical protein